MKSVSILTDDVVIASGLTHIFSETEEFELTAAFAEPAAMLEKLSHTQGDIVLIDMNVGVPLSFVADILKVCPTCRICLWTQHITDDLAYQAMTLGVRGILRRPLPVSDVLGALRKLAANEVWFEEKLMAGFFCNRVVRLTPRESQLVSLLVQGLKNKEIAYRLSLSEGTVKVYFSKLFEKLGVKDRFELALYGMRNLSLTPSGCDGPAASVVSAFTKWNSTSARI